MKKPTKAVILAVSIFLGWTGWKGAQALLSAGPSAVFTEKQGEKAMTPQVKKSPEEWKKTLSPEQYRVMFECGTEPAFS